VWQLGWLRLGGTARAHRNFGLLLRIVRISLIPATGFTVIPDSVSRDAGRRFTPIPDSSRPRE